MSGSGTSAVETVAAGRGGLFSDIDPLSTLLTRAKTQPIQPDELTNIITSLIEGAQPFERRGASVDVARKQIEELENSTRFRAPPDVFHWFQPYVAINVCKILGSANRLNLQGRERNAIMACIAATIRRLSRADPNTASGLEVTKVRSIQLKHGLRFDVKAELIRKATILATGYREMLSVNQLGDITIVNYDARHWSDACRKAHLWPSLVVTSPCYLSAIEYWRRHKLEHCWLGLVDPQDLDKTRRGYLGMGQEEPKAEGLTPSVKQIHAELVKQGRTQQAKFLARYFEDSEEWLKEVGVVLQRSHGTAYVVVAGNTTHGMTINTPHAIKEIVARLSGLRCETAMRYRIKNSYMQYTTKTERIKEETVLKVSAA
jgi:hypothetical protein